MPAPTDPETIALLRLVRRELRAAGDATRARQMTADMKTDMPFYGVQKPARVRIERAVVARFPLETGAAIISQVVSKDETDAAQLFDYCRRCMHEKPFFIRKAIGWALRAHAATDPEAVTEFLRVHRDELSPLSFREAAKWLEVYGRRLCCGCFWCPGCELGGFLGGRGGVHAAFAVRAAGAACFGRALSFGLRDAAASSRRALCCRWPS